ncbi:MAG: 2-amino-4-hydroxy-6-hydroxymethyldihydropteridine diphosphokinase [Clostridia bacterium]|nr:2-amino-4-hydroxy-6-hydroxymethyldihydropteridine diphosphokinase [Clostridia bacterium]
MIFYIALGSNMLNPIENLQKGIESFNLIPNTKVLGVSGIYETPPWGYENQDNFLNCVIKGETDLSPEALLGACLGIEAALGRVREIKNGPRILDADLLLYEDEERDTNELVLPHPRMLERSFVMVPLMDIYDGERYDEFEKITSTLSKENIKRIV